MMVSEGWNEYMQGSKVLATLDSIWFGPTSVGTWPKQLETSRFHPLTTPIDLPSVFDVQPILTIVSAHRSRHRYSREFAATH
jgi:hypothetical protein